MLPALDVSYQHNVIDTPPFVITAAQGDLPKKERRMIYKLIASIRRY